MRPLYETYRPTSWDQVIGQDKAVKLLEGLAARSWGGRAIWIAGPSGGGKTTLARIYARLEAHPQYIREEVARDLSISKLRDIFNSWMYLPMFGTGQALIINEAHGLSKPLIEYLLDAIEGLSEHCCIIFTTTRAGNDLFEEKLDSSPFKSRCTAFNTAARNVCKPFAARAKQIAQTEGLNGKPDADYIKLIKKHGNNLRAALMDIEAGAML